MFRARLEQVSRVRLEPSVRGRGVSAKGRAGAESTRGRALNCIIPPLLALHPSLHLCGFRVLYSSDRILFFILEKAMISE